MTDLTKKYANNEITIVWKPDSCIHSTLCWKGLRAVFRPREKPWINAAGAGSEAIIEQVKKCPSGALSYYYNEHPAPPASAAETIVEVTPNGPLMVHGRLTVKHADGTCVQKNQVTAFCRCGSSANKPFCDGSHRKTGFSG